MPAKIDLTGARYGRLLVTAEAERSRTGARRVLCSCDCGNETSVFVSALRGGLTQSCGCLERENRSLLGARFATHGLSRTPEYRIWKGMKARCECETNSAYKKYGALGVKVCAEWRSSFESFLSDVGPRPGDRMTLDRINPFGDYEPGNCRWATPEEQARNKRKTPGVFGIQGIYWNRHLGVFQVRSTPGQRARQLGVTKDFFEACCLRKSFEADLSQTTKPTC